MLSLQKIENLIKTEVTRFVSLKPGASTDCYLNYGLVPGIFYVNSRTGWDMNENGSLIYYINELGTWVPAKYLDVNKGIIPN